MPLFSSKIGKTNLLPIKSMLSFTQFHLFKGLLNERGKSPFSLHFDLQLKSVRNVEIQCLSPSRNVDDAKLVYMYIYIISVKKQSMFSKIG